MGFGIKNQSKHKIQFMLLAYLSISAFFTFGCAGPTSPFGALEPFTGDGNTVHFEEQNADEISVGESSMSDDLDKKPIQFFPQRQVLHEPADLMIKIKPSIEIKDNYELKVTYNKKEISHVFHKNMELKENIAANEIAVRFDNIRLSPDVDHSISVSFLPDNKLGKKQRYTGHFLPPDCPFEKDFEILSTGGFQLENHILSKIRDEAQRNNFNPALLAGIIAQESGYNPKAVSGSRAIGLTQVTPLADQQIFTKRPDWPRDQRLLSWPIWRLKMEIESDAISPKEDWRLDPMKSIEGGGLYVTYINNYWNLEENKEILNKYVISKGEVLLASYNSGPARVKKAILESKSDWIKNSNLKEAHKYVRRVSSYCYHFAQNGSVQ